MDHEGPHRAGRVRLDAELAHRLVAEDLDLPAGLGEAIHAFGRVVLEREGRSRRRLDRPDRPVHRVRDALLVSDYGQPTGRVRRGSHPGFRAGVWFMERSPTKTKGHSDC
jgi:hypothetical protein